MVVNPALSSASQLAQTYVTQQPQEQKITDKTSTNRTAAENDTVTLSDRAQQLSSDSTAESLAASQQVNNKEAAENNTTEANQTTNGLTYGTDTQSKANYYQTIADQTLSS